MEKARGLMRGMRSSRYSGGMAQVVWGKSQRACEDKARRDLVHARRQPTCFSGHQRLLHTAVPHCPQPKAPHRVPLSTNRPALLPSPHPRAAAQSPPQSPEGFGAGLNHQWKSKDTSESG